MNKKLESIKIDFESLKVGDKVWSTTHGECIIHDLKDSIGLIAINNGILLRYDKEGRIRANSPIVVFKSNPFDLISEYPKEMRVSMDGKNWETRTVIGIDEKKSCCVVRIPSTNTGYTHWTFWADIEPETTTNTEVENPDIFYRR